MAKENKLVTLENTRFKSSSDLEWTHWAVAKVWKSDQIRFLLRNGNPKLFVFLSLVLIICLNSGQESDYRRGPYLMGLDLLEWDHTLSLKGRSKPHQGLTWPSTPQHSYSYPSSVLLLPPSYFAKWICFTKVLYRVWHKILDREIHARTWILFHLDWSVLFSDSVRWIVDIQILK